MKHYKHLIFIVAYNAEKHICSVLDRIPKSLHNSETIDILIIDDASKDKTSERAAEWAVKEKSSNLKVLRNPYNQRYGGNQKLGYTYAIQNNYDFVILLHGDGQYAPELLELFIKTYEDNLSDVVLGSRMIDWRSARKGGMPFYKLAGNTILTRFQNIITRQKISEYHTGYRGYSTQFLKAVPFHLNTDEFHFDTEILLQAFHISARIDEFAIPTHYGDEVCHVNGMKYAGDIIKSTLQFKMHAMGMFCSLKYRNLDHSHYQDKLTGDYTTHSMALKWIDELKPNSVMDLGCGPGHVSRKIREKMIRVVGVDQYPPSPGSVDDFRQTNLEKDPIPWNGEKFDVLLFLDVIEHLSEPEEFLLNLRHYSPDSKFKLLISTPNVAFLAVRFNLLLGRFNYASRGILDITHKRLFTKTSFQTLAEETGYVIQRWAPVAPPFEAVIPGLLGKSLAAISSFLSLILPGLFAFQFLSIWVPKPGVSQILLDAEIYYTPEPNSSNTKKPINS